MSKSKKILRDIKLSEVLGTELNPLSKKVKEFIDDKLEGLVKFESDEYPGDFLYKKDDIILFKQDLKGKWLCCSHHHYWVLFKEEIGLSYGETQELTKALVGAHLNCKKFIPVSVINSIY